jgi:hypothetical protein
VFIACYYLQCFHHQKCSDGINNTIFPDYGTYIFLVFENAICVCSSKTICPYHESYILMISLWKMPPTFPVKRTICRRTVVLFCKSLFVLLYFFLPLCCLLFFDIRILITSLRYLHTLLIFIAWKHFWLYPYMYFLLFLIVSVLASSLVDRKFELRSDPTNDYKTGTCCFSCRHLTHIITSHRNTTCSRTDITVKNCSFGGKQQTFTYLVVNNRHSLIPLLLMTIRYSCKELLIWW